MSFRIFYTVILLCLITKPFSFAGEKFEQSDCSNLSAVDVDLDGEAAYPVKISSSREDVLQNVVQRSFEAAFGIVEKEIASTNKEEPGFDQLLDGALADIEPEEKDVKEKSQEPIRKIIENSFAKPFIEGSIPKAAQKPMAEASDQPLQAFSNENSKSLNKEISQSNYENLIQELTTEPIEIAPPIVRDEPKVIKKTCPEFEVKTKKEIISRIDTILNKSEGYTVNFDNVDVVQLISFISKISETNFVFDSKDLDRIKITIVSDEPTSVKDLMASLLQVLQMHGLSVSEQGNNVLIFKDQSVGKISTIVTDANLDVALTSPIVTRVFRLYNLSPEHVSKIISPLLSKDATVSESPETRHLIVSDITANVDKIAELLAALDTPNAALDIAEYEVKSAYPAVLVTYAREIIAPLAQNNPIQFIAQPSAHKIFIVSTPYLITKAMHILCSLDIPEITEVVDIPPSHVAGNNFQVYKLKYREGREVAQAIRDIGANLRYMSAANVDLISAISSVQWIEANNTLVVSGTQEALDKVIQLINDLDVAPKQVFIEVLIIDTSIAHSLTFGVEWIALANEQNKLAFASGFLNPPPSTAPSGSLTGQPQAPLFGGARTAMNSPPPNASRGGAPGTGGDVPLTSGFGLGIIGNILRHNGQSFLTLGALLQALESDNDTTVVLNPRIMAQDTYQAHLFAGQNIPYQTTSTIVRDTGSVTQNLQYEDVGVELTVTPHVGPNNIVTLEIDQAVNEVVSATASIQSVGSGPTLLLAPTTNKTLATTRVLVPDGCFLVMSGHIRDRASCARSGIPCLGTLPLIGPAFSTTSNAREKRNLIMFLRPHVVSDVEEGVSITNLQGYEYNWESHPSSLQTCPPKTAPEFETCTNPP